MNFSEFRARQQETTIDGLKVSFVDQGQGPVLLLIHGIPIWGYLWKDCLEPLAANFRVIIPDSNHFFPLEKGPEVAQILLNYLKGAQPT